MRKYFFLFLCFIFIILFTNNVHAFSSNDYKIILYDSTSEVVSCPNSTCWTGLMRDIVRVSIVNYSNSVVGNSPYSLLSSIEIESDYNGNNLPFRNDKWLGNSQFSQWVPLTTAWNNIDSVTQGSLPYTHVFNWGYVGNFTPTFNSSGFVFDFYFTQPGINIWGVEVTRYDLNNNGTSNEDLINNQTNTIINNNNTNTQNIIDSQTDIKDAITDDSIDSDSGSDFFDGFDDDDYGLSDIITLPLSTIQSLTSKSCVVLNVPVPFTNSNISLPCMTEVYQHYLPSVFSLWQTVTFGILSYYIALDIFRIVKGFKNPDEDKIEVLDL